MFDHGVDDGGQAIRVERWAADKDHAATAVKGERKTRRWGVPEED